ncbi:Aspartate racemase [Fructilactobacillus florum 8D]|uniref:Aspartate racemase n=2 Tax=Fructilactobacillus florum TaxID=640331 RepID=W9EGJ8_9LACO|nr:amino acid racemase [Fructilactobacillus florum]EKK20655.1 Aspartate racemase [Fructilactobacillus florum 2F]ETO40120.1 Aspartate racemase [Fructilactobacillus florum 8D]KRM91861.1 aspartate racemase [Fructilactobacillus florum DSM 22689 = JCM 16035]
MKDFFTIIGGMGTEATESYLHLLNQRTPAHRDQDYLNYILVNHATVPDRTDYIMDHTQPSPLPPLATDIKQQSLLNPAFFALPCNTAHYFYQDLQELTTVPILHMPRLAVASIKTKFPSARRIGLVATQGTLHDRIYEKELVQAGYQFVMPSPEVAHDTMELIYAGVKEQNQVDPNLYHKILRQMIVTQHCDVVVLGCTELSVADQRVGNGGYPVIDAQSELVDETLRRALQLRTQQA